MGKRAWIRLAAAAAILMAISSAAGVFESRTYARETQLWAAEAVGQDIANLFCVFPAILIALHFANRGSVRASLLAIGLLIYVVYSYVLYAFFVHFGPWFLVYVAVLALSAYALAGSVIHIGSHETLRLSGAGRSSKTASLLLLVLGFLFAAMWLSEIVRALLSGTAPAGVTDTGLPVNPVHVLDLAFLLPGMILTAISMRQGKPLGLLFAVPLLTFSAAMGIAILAMFYAMNARGFPVSVAPLVLMAVVAAASVCAAGALTREMKA